MVSPEAMSLVSVSDVVPRRGVGTIPLNASSRFARPAANEGRGEGMFEAMKTAEDASCEREDVLSKKMVKRRCREVVPRGDQEKTRCNAGAASF